MRLRGEQVARYHRDGFLLVNALFTENEVHQMKAEALQILQNGCRQKKNGMCLGVSLSSDLFCRINSDNRLTEILSSIIGPNIEFWSDRIIFKGKEANLATPWHQDWQYWKGSHKTSVWVALDDATKCDGCLKFIPGSHKLGEIKHGEVEPISGEGFRYRLDVDERDCLEMSMAAGDAVFFDDLTVHGSLPNKSGRDRWALISTFRDPKTNEPAYRDGRCESFMVLGSRPYS